ncbi:MAG: hypothetical protein ACRDJU_11515 [Actinomycetota bacterium]
MRQGLLVASFAAVIAIVASACSSTPKAAKSPTPAPTESGSAPFLDQFKTIAQVGSTVPVNGDVNPYGIAAVPSTGGN